MGSRRSATASRSPPACCASASASAATARARWCADLSGGERRRLALMRLLMERPERAAARRAHQRPRHRHPDRARGPARRLAGHARRGQPRPLLRRAGLRRRVRAHRRRRDPPSARAASSSTSSCAEPRPGRVPGRPGRVRPGRVRPEREGQGRERPGRARPRRAPRSPPVRRPAPPARSSSDSSGRSIAAPRASTNCTSRWPRTQPITPGWASCRASCSACSPSGRSSRPTGSGRPSRSSADRSGGAVQGPAPRRDGEERALVRQGAPARVRQRAPQSAPRAAASATDAPAPSASVNAAANESPHP